MTDDALPLVPPSQLDLHLKQRTDEGPRNIDETPEEREEAVAVLGKERINPVFASEYIDGYIRRCR